ncbi:MAG TPA: LytTR family DNA-binding domain-containing protein [Rhizomicrobium sp.]|jgi:two-component system LytT family response regulator|nr:LytTR family DNA-binding domain-containing protein [Rhizomicrobium sp.]
MKLRILIVDDMPLSRQRTQRYLADVPEVEVVGECGDAESALEAIDRLAPNLLLLDVQMPGLTGFQLLERMPPDRRPVVIFVTAFAEFAVKAFVVQAVDYLLKPFDRERLAQALAKARDGLGRSRAAAPAPAPAETPIVYLDRIAVKSVGKTVFVSTSAIDWIETAGNYVCLHADKDTHLVRATMNQLESQLDPRRFVRIHRSTMVRIEAVKEIHPLFNGDQTVFLANGDKVVLSRSYREKAQAALGLR